MTTSVRSVIQTRIPLRYIQLKARIMRDLGIGTVKLSTSLTKEADSRERVTTIPDKLTQIFLNHDKKKCFRNGA